MAKTVSKEKFIALQAYIRKETKSQIDNLSSQVSDHKANKKKEITPKQKINETEK